MYRDQNVRAWIGWLGVILLVVGGGCDRSVGAGDFDAGANANDAAPLADAVVQPDADDLVENVLGWHSSAEEHAGVVAAADVDNDLLDACSSWLMAADGGETWWTYGTSAEALLPLYPNPDHWAGIGLGLITGHLSSLGQYGHMGMYDRELWVTGWELAVCATVERARHCVAPRAQDFCQLPEAYYDTRRIHLSRILPGPAGDSDLFALTIYYDEGVGDGETRILINFGLPHITDPGPSGWTNIPAAELTDLTIAQERLWFAYELIPYPDALDGWVLRSTNTESEVLRLSLSAQTANGQPLHIWGDFPVNDTIGYP